MVLLLIRAKKKRPKVYATGIQPETPTENLMHQTYIEYFKGKYHDLFLKSSSWRETLQMPNSLRQELEPYNAMVPLNQIRVFEIKAHEIPLSALPAGSTSSEWTTVLEEVRDLEKNIN